MRTRAINTKRTLTEDQLKLLITKSEDSKIYLFVLFAGLMGLRRGEILGLKYTDINYVERTIHIQRQLGRDYDEKYETVRVKRKAKSHQELDVKTKSSNRILEIPDILFEAIIDERSRYEKNRSRRINDRLNPFQDDEYIICSTYGKPRGPSYVFTHFKKLLEENNLSDIRFHDLRSTYTTILIKNEFSPKAVSKLLGHSSEIITLDIYTDKNNVVNNVVKPIEKFISEVVKEEENFNEIYDNVHNYLLNYV